VMKRIAPGAEVIDITHGIPPQQVLQGALVLSNTLPYMPVGVHLAVVDPGVGSARRGVVVVAGPSLLVGPDNGLLLPAAAALGGVTAAFELTEPRYRLPDVSMTFHGRDVFAPAAAYLADGVAPSAFGPEVTDLVRPELHGTTVADGQLTSEIIGVDRFGNVQLAAGRPDLDTLGVRGGDRVRVRLRKSTLDGTVGSTFGDVPGGALLVHVDSAGQVALAVNGGSAAEALTGSVGDVTITPIP
jgi:S-adenosyl-L-methionine hydrolase (adenosine-forming)